MIEVLLTLVYILLTSAVIVKTVKVLTFTIDVEKIILTMVSIWVFFILVFYKYHLDKSLRQITNKGKNEKKDKS